jgi:hypothetical protein
MLYLTFNLLLLYIAGNSVIHRAVMLELQVFKVFTV